MEQAIVKYYTKTDLLNGYVSFITKCASHEVAETILRDWKQSGQTHYLGAEIVEVRIDTL